jgi:hypothetical protein
MAMMAMTYDVMHTFTDKDNANRKKELSMITAKAWVISLRLIGHNVDMDKLGELQLSQ